MTFQLLTFYALALVAVGSSLAMVGFVRGLVPAVGCLVATMLSLALAYTVLGAPFVASAQLLVHTVAVTALLRVAIDRFGLESGFTTRNLPESVMKGLASAVVLLIAIVFAIHVLTSSAGETVGYAVASTADPGVSGSGATVLLGVAALLVLLSAVVAVGLFVRWRAD